MQPQPSKGGSTVKKTQAQPTPPPDAYAPYYQYGNRTEMAQGDAAPLPAARYPEAQPAPAQYQNQYYTQPQQDYPTEEPSAQPQPYQQYQQPCQGQPIYYQEQPQAPVQSRPNESRGADGAPSATPGYYDYTVPQTYQEVRKYEGSNKWAVGMWKSPCRAPGMCFGSFFCPCCCTFMQRKKLLVDNWENYRCCAGTCAYACCACFNNNNCGGGAPFCLAMETIFCLPCAVHANRYMVMRHYGLQNECCDLVLMWSACICQIISCIIGDGCLDSLADCWYFIVLSCMLAQQEYQMKMYPYPTQTMMT